LNKIESINRVFQFLILSIFVYSNSVLAEGYWGLRNINAQLPDSLYQSFGAIKDAFSISWARTERQDDEYTWDMLDNMLDFIQRNNGEGVLLFQMQSGWATGGESRAPNDLDRDTPLGDEVPENGYSELLYDFAYQVAIHIYEYEGEPEVRYFRYGPEPQYEWETTPDTYEQDIEDYVRCLRTFYLAIHAAGEDHYREVLVSHGGFYYISQLEREWFRLGEANEDVQDSLLTLLQSRNERHAFRYRQWEDLVRRMNPRDGIPPTYWMDVMAGQTDFLDWFDVRYHWKPRFIWDELGAFEHVVQDSGGELKPWLAAEAAMQLAEGSLTEYEERFHAADMARKWVLGMAFGLKGICTPIVGFPPDRFLGYLTRGVMSICLRMCIETLLCEISF